MATCLRSDGVRTLDCTRTRSHNCQVKMVMSFVDITANVIYRNCSLTHTHNMQSLSNRIKWNWFVMKVDGRDDGNEQQKNQKSNCDVRSTRKYPSSNNLLASYWIPLNGMDFVWKRYTTCANQYNYIGHRCKWLAVQLQRQNMVEWSQYPIQPNDDCSRQFPTSLFCCDDWFATIFSHSLSSHPNVIYMDDERSNRRTLAVCNLAQVRKCGLWLVAKVWLAVLSIHTFVCQ